MILLNSFLNKNKNLKEEFYYEIAFTSNRLTKCFYNEHTNKLLNKIKAIIDSNKYDDVVFTRFINFEDSIFVNKLSWRSCIEDKDKKIVIDTKDNKIFDSFKLEYNVYVLKDYCACMHGIERHNNALEILRRNIRKDFVI